MRKKGENIVGTRLVLRRKELGLTQLALAKLCNTQREQIARWELGVVNPDRHIVDLANAMGVSVDWLVGRVSTVNHMTVGDATKLRAMLEGFNDRAKLLHNRGEFVKIPLLGSIPAGPLTPMDPSDAEDQLDVPLFYIRCFALKVQGDSMEPEFKKNDTLIIEPLNVELPPIEDGRIVQVPYEHVAPYRDKPLTFVLNGAVTFKFLKLTQKSKPAYRVTLLPLNSAHKPVEVGADDELLLQGRVVQMQRNY